MKYRTITAAVFALFITSFGEPRQSLGAQPEHGRSGDLLATKECSAYTGAAGSFCTITSSNIPEIKVGSTVYYDQQAGIPSGLVDSNVILDAKDGNRAIGRCTLDLATGLGLCTFSDGTGQFAGFEARANVSFLGRADWKWEGSYKFTPVSE